MTKENAFSYSPPIIDMEQVLPASQCICQIETDTNRGTGFFVKLPLQRWNRQLRGLMTNTHIINQEDSFFIKVANDYSFETRYLFEKAKSTSNFEFTSTLLDVSFFELDENTIQDLNITRFLEIETNIIYGSPVSVVQYTNGYPKLKQETGMYLGDWGFEILHQIKIDPNSSGSPLLTSSSKVLGICQTSKNQCNSATKIDTVVYGISKLLQTSLERPEPAPLPQEKIDILEQHGLTQTSHYLIFISPGNDNVTPLWFYRTKHAWYWTPKKPILSDLRESNWSIIGVDCPILAIGGIFHDQPPVQSNRELIKWLISTEFQYL